MPKSWQYPRWRRVAMQAVMWVILGATVALAALVSHEVRRSRLVQLADERTLDDNLAVRLPKGWQDGAGPGDTAPWTGRVMITAEEPPAAESENGGGGGGRRLTISRQR